MVDNEKGLQKLIANIQSYINKEIGLVECLEKHQHLCFNDLDSHTEYFSDGWSKDTTLNLFKYVVRAVNGDEKAMSRLRVDLGIEDCNLTIVHVK